ncbi:efflux RND transporter periplasmic adaptor subunit [Sneathiella chinensis]|uniref:MexH family multidrug efflux RND transporter periplasmic adaptor subunit n=1 Tax=Sneathiella chinensis TaxID=349750 RepID=A0ABQ5U3R3_9PROT|nr:efflux RND transporter periplasmic adaptor subunit [Sneathiella chinensis]GLQ06376.1 MexH family multidrug efflux RND transporter periplasmic adaptor subunit [Sneathiella chinensis]
MKRIGRILLAVAVIAAAYAGWKYQDRIPFLSDKNTATEGAPRGARAVPVIAQSVILRDLPEVVSAVGTLLARESVDITSKVSAKVVRLNITEGGHAEKGQPLVYLDATELEAQLAETRASLENSRKLYARAQKLFKTRNVPASRVEELLSDLQVAEAKVLATQARLDHYVIRAPFSGKLGLREVSLGSLVRPGDLITTLDDIVSLKLDFDLPERNLASIRPGQTFQATSVAFEGRSFLGEIRTIATRIDPVTRAVRIRGIIPNDSGELRPGMFLSVQLRTGTTENAVLVPEQAVTISAAGHFVYEIVDGTTIRREVTIGRRVPGWAQVVAGLGQEAVVVTEGLQKIKDGGKVLVTLEQPTALPEDDGKGLMQ